MSDFNLFDALFQSDRAESVAVLCDQREISYRELREEVVRAAEVLNALGISVNDRVAILLNDSPEFIASFVGVISLGAVAVPINMALRHDEQRLILKDCGARAAIVEADACAELLGSADRAADGLPLPGLRDLLVVTRTGEVTAAFAGIHTEVFESAKYQPISREFPVRPAEDAPAFILYTSGSTGEPKGAIHTQAHIDYANRTYCAEVLRLREGDRLFSSSRLPFAYGLGNALTFPLLNGVTTILCREKPLPEVISRVFENYRPTIFFGVPVVYRMLLDHHHKVSAIDSSSLRLCVSAGEALPAQLGEEWQRTVGVEVLDGIGSTEMLHMFMSNHESEVRYGSSGRLLRGYEAKLIDHEGNATPESEVGNLWIRGASAAAAYWERPETTAQTFADGWVRTGDLYRCDGDGYWWHMGRGDDCFKPTGQWVSPVEVEGVLSRHEGVGRAAVVEGFDESGLSCVCAFIVTSDGAAAVEDELRALCEGALPRFKQPRRYIFVTELPYTATGKIQRFKLREQLRGARTSVASEES
jgi:benzoate-CoA ligase family protein